MLDHVHIRKVTSEFVLNGHNLHHRAFSGLGNRDAALYGGRGRSINLAVAACLFQAPVLICATSARVNMQLFRINAPVALALLFSVLMCVECRAVPHATDARETVVLLHGLARSAGSMSRLERALTLAGYAVCNFAQQR